MSPKKDWIYSPSVGSLAVAVFLKEFDHRLDESENLRLLVFNQFETAEFRKLFLYVVYGSALTRVSYIITFRVVYGERESASPVINTGSLYK